MAGRSVKLSAYELSYFIQFYNPCCNYHLMSSSPELCHYIISQGLKVSSSSPGHVWHNYNDVYLGQCIGINPKLMSVPVKKLIEYSYLNDISRP